MRGSGNHLIVLTAAWLVVCGNAALTFLPPLGFDSYVVLLVQHVVVAGMLTGALWYVFRQTAGRRAWVALGGLLALASLAIAGSGKRSGCSQVLGRRATG